MSVWEAGVEGGYCTVWVFWSKTWDLFHSHRWAFFFVFQGINTSHVIPWVKEMQSVFVWLIKSFKNPFILGYIAVIFRKQFTKNFIPPPPQVCISLAVTWFSLLHLQNSHLLTSAVLHECQFHTGQSLRGPLCLSSAWVLGAPVKSFQHLSPPRLCISITVVPASLGIWLIGKLELAEEVEDNVQVFYLNKHTLQFILLDFVLWIRTPQVILLQTRNCLLTPDYKPQSVLLCLWKHISL